MASKHLHEQEFKLVLNMDINEPAFEIGQIVRYNLSVEDEQPQESDDSDTDSEPTSQQTAPRYPQDSVSMAGAGWRFKKSRAKITAIFIGATDTQYTIQLQVFKVAQFKFKFNSNSI